MVVFSLTRDITGTIKNNDHISCMNDHPMAISIHTLATGTTHLLQKFFPNQVLNM